MKKFKVEIECMNNLDVPNGKLIVESNAKAGEGCNFVYLTIGENTLELSAIEVIDAITRITGQINI